MRSEGLLRLVELVRRELDAADVRAELGGREPKDEHVVWCKMSEGFRLVAEFEEVPKDRQSLLERMQALITAFAETASPSRSDPEQLREPLTRRLDAELEALAYRAGAVHAFVIDDKSPVIWGTSASRRLGEDVDMTIRVHDLELKLGEAGLDMGDLLSHSPDAIRELLGETSLPSERVDRFAKQLERLIESAQRHDRAFWQQYLLVARALTSIRALTRSPDYVSGHVRETVHGDGWGYLVRAFAGIYVLGLVFEGQFSELHAEAAVVHALPLVERLVLALPPIDPEPSGAKVMRLRRD
jgi:hypothetical protein